MKRHILSTIIIALTTIVNAQAPHAFNYQAILRNTDGTVKADETISLQVSIVNDQGASQYLEVHNTQTNEFGLVNVVIGEGTTSDALSAVDWSAGPYFLDITVNGENLGSSPLLSVPYALFAESGNEGPQGPPGPQGIQGERGEQGPQGEPGDTKWSEVSEGIAYTEGYVGIGTITPQTPLHVNAPHVPTLGQFVISTESGQDIQYSFLENGEVRAYMWWDADQADLRLQNNINGDLNLNPYGGNVSVGTISPSEKLDVNGNLRVRGDLIVDGVGGEEPLITVSELIDLLNKQGIIPNNYAGTVTDIDGNVYKTVKIGDQIWMAENLRVIHYSDGTEIPLLNTSDPYFKAYCWYNNDINIGRIYGALYTWAAAMNGEVSSSANPSGVQGVCPAGWHLPSDAEWKQLEMYLGMSPAEADNNDWRGTNEGGKIKEMGTIHWNSPNTEATNESGFTALPSGFCGVNGEFFKLGSITSFHVTTVLDPSFDYSRVLSSDQSKIARIDVRDISRSVRCVKDSP